jgi:hypothetical protein
MRNAGAQLALIFSVLSLIAVNAASAASPTADVSGCVIRFHPAGPQIHVNRTHECPGVRSVSVDENGMLVVRRSGAGSIQSVSVSPDETLSARGIVAGASGGVGITRVRFFDTTTGKPLPADSPKLHGPTANVWLTWVS